MKSNLYNLFMVSRPVSWINTAFPFAAGYLVSGENFGLYLVLVTLFFLIPYNVFLYGINDVFDYESDLNNPRKGGIEGAMLDRSTHGFILVASTLFVIPFLIYMLAVGTLLSNAVLLFVMFSVIAYSAPILRFKERPFIDSITSSLHFAGPLLFALSLTNGFSGAWPAVIAFFAWGMASHAFGAVQDINADRAGSLSSIATALGAKKTVRFAIGCYVVAGLSCIAYGYIGIVLITIAGAYIVNIWRYRNLNDDACELANRGWRRFIWMNLGGGFIITQIIIITLLQRN